MGIIAANAPVKKTYRVSGELVAAASIGVFLAINGAANRVIRISRIIIHAPVLTTAQLLRISVTKHSAVHTAGTSTNPTKVPLDSTAPASLATIAAYTVVPGTGALVGQISERKVIAQSSTLVVSAPLDEGDFNFTNGEQSTEYPTIRGAAENIAVQFPVAPATAVTLSYTIEYTEDGN